MSGQPGGSDGPLHPPAWTRRPASSLPRRLERRPFTRQPPLFRSLLETQLIRIVQIQQQLDESRSLKVDKGNADDRRRLRAHVVREDGGAGAVSRRGAQLRVVVRQRRRRPRVQDFALEIRQGQDALDAGRLIGWGDLGRLSHGDPP